MSTLAASVVTCTPLKGVKSWAKLERALLIGFRLEYGQQPVCNGDDRVTREDDEFEYFEYERVRRVLAGLS
jgi:hypothetical protein